MTDSIDPLHQNLGVLRKRCAHIRRAIKEVGLPDPRNWEPGFATLIKIIVDQQVSVAAGASIWAKLVKACKGRVTAKRLIALTDPELRACGLSGQKARYARGAAEAVVAGQLDFKRLHSATDDEVRAMLTALKGIGPWSADIYLLFAVGRPDVWPVAYLALQHGVRMLHGHPDRPTLKEMEEIAEIWRPYRSRGGDPAVALLRGPNGQEKGGLSGSRAPRVALKAPQNGPEMAHCLSSLPPYSRRQIPSSRNLSRERHKHQRRHASPPRRATAPAVL